MIRPTARQLDLVDIAIDSAARAVAGFTSSGDNQLAREYRAAGRSVLTWVRRSPRPVAHGHVAVALTRRQVEALLDACVLADGFEMDVLTEDGDDGNKARAKKALRDRAFSVLHAAVKP